MSTNSEVPGTGSDAGAGSDAGTDAGTAAEAAAVARDLGAAAKRGGAAIGDFIREQREQAQVSLRQLARLAGVSNPYLSQVERGLRRPSAEILQQIATGLKISAEQLYVRAGILETRHGDPGVVAAVLADPGLRERHKQALIEIYESFRREKDVS